MTTSAPPRSGDSHSDRRGRRWWLAGALTLAGALGAGYALGAHHNQAATTAERAMADRAASVMPFDLNATTHSFTKTDVGGVEQIAVNNPADQTDIALIRHHLRYEADQFARGDYTDPATIHGAGMPGLHDLETNAQRIQIRYQEIPTGAGITYSATDPALITALHTWFDTQTHDHHMPGMGMGN